jgi:hypothetical protein
MTVTRISHSLREAAATAALPTVDAKPELATATVGADQGE